MSNISIIGELPDFGENDTLTIEDDIKRGDIVFFERKDSETVVVKLVDLNDLPSFVGKAYLVVKGGSSDALVFEQVDIAQLQAELYESSQIEALLERAFSNLSFFYRDANLSVEILDKYYTGLIIQERAFVDASYRAGGLVAKHRYLIVTPNARDLSMVPPANPEQGLVVIMRDSFFKVLDVYESRRHTQITLLDIPEALVDVLDRGAELSDMEKEIAEAARADFDKHLAMKPVSALTDSEWLERVSFPLGMNDDGEFFYNHVPKDQRKGR